MHAIILAAGRGSRMGELTSNRPKSFIEVSERPIYQHQISQLVDFCDRILIVCGYGFETKSEAENAFDTDEYETKIDLVHLSDWNKFENGYSAEYAIKRIKKDTGNIPILLVCGDILFKERLINNAISEFEGKLLTDQRSGVCVIEGIQENMTGVTWDNNQNINSYGAITGHQEAGLFFLHPSHIDRSIKVLKENRDYWFPIIFEEVPASPIIIDESLHTEINTPEDLDSARRKQFF